MATAEKEITKLSIDHEMTIYTAAAMKAQLMEVLDKNADVELDLSQVSELDTAGLQLLILAKRECLARNGTLRLVRHSPAVLDVLNMCNMIQFFGDPIVISSQAH